MLFVDFLNSNHVGFGFHLRFKQKRIKGKLFLTNEAGAVPILYDPKTPVGAVYHKCLTSGFLVSEFKAKIMEISPDTLSNETLRMMGLFNTGLLDCILFDAQGKKQKYAHITYPIFSQYRPNDEQPLTGHYCLDRFCLIRREEAYIILERPLKEFRIYTQNVSANALFIALMAGGDIAKIIAKQPKKFQPAARFLIGLFIHEGLLLAMDNKTPPTRLQEGKPHQVCWEFHDLLFHGNSRAGYEVNFMGGVFPYIDKIDPLPANSTDQHQWQGEIIPLYKPNYREMTQKDMPMGVVMELRNTIRQYNEQCPMTAEKLGEFLYRTGRVKVINSQMVDSDSFGEKRQCEMEVTYRPYPSGGASYESDFFITIDRCADLASGFYFYDPYKHHLVKIHDRTPLVEKTIRFANISMAQLGTPPVVVHIAARFMRVNWKYKQMAYAAIQKNTGVIYSTFYQVATQMGLAPCGLGSGDIKTFAELTGLDPSFQGSVGDFGLGIPPVGFINQRMDYITNFIDKMADGTFVSPYNLKIAEKLRNGGK